MGRFERIEAQALYRLSHAYECLGLNRKLIASLQDAAARVLDHFPARRTLEIDVIWLDMPARLQPLPQLGVVHEQDGSSIGRYDKSAGSEVSGIEMVARERLTAGVQEFNH